MLVQRPGWSADLGEHLRHRDLEFRSWRPVLGGTEGHRRKGASIEFLKERLTFAPGDVDPMDAFQLNMMGAFAQFERELIRQRQAEGIAAAKKRGAYKGRSRSLESDQIRSVRNAALAGTPKAQIAREHGISRSTLYRYLDTPTLPLAAD